MNEGKTYKEACQETEAALTDAEKELLVKWRNILAEQGDPPSLEYLMLELMDLSPEEFKSRFLSCVNFKEATQ